MVGILGVIVLIVFQDVTINNESDYYSIKEAMEASMIESIDKSYYAKTGELKIVEQKFVANFTRRFINNSVGSSQGYSLEFYDIMESPPKATVIIRNATDLLVMSEDNADIVNNLTAILEATVDRNTYEDYYCNGTIKSGTYKYSDYYSNLPKGEKSSYRLNIDYIKGQIGLADGQIKNLRVAEITDVKLLNGSRSVDLSNAYVSWLNGSSWIPIVSGFSNKTGSELNNCYTAGVHVSIVDAYGDANNGYPTVKVITEVNSTSTSGCGDNKGNSLVQYSVVWKYDYCEG